jgi:hypothetical protein
MSRALSVVRSIALSRYPTTVVSAGGLEIYLNSCRVLVKDFADFAKSMTERIRKAAYDRFRQLGRPIQYLDEPSLSKEDVARALAKKHGITTGPICLLACVEPCLSFQLRGDRQAKQCQPLSLHAAVQSGHRISVMVCLSSVLKQRRLCRQAAVSTDQNQGT